MYQYEVQFWLADDVKKDKIDLQDWRSVFDYAEEKFNEMGKFARNPKKIIKSDVEKKHIKLLFESKVPLSTPTLALRAYSKILCNTDFGKEAVVNGALFRGNWSVLENERENITGPEMIKILAEMIMSGKKSDEENLEKIKIILMEWREKNIL